MGGHQGHEEYVPQFQVRRGDFASRGRSSYTPSLQSERHHELLSALERETLNSLQLLSPHEIREQYPLRWDYVEDEFLESAPTAQGTVEIANSLGIKHPQFGHGDPKRMTTDFLVTRRDGSKFAVHVKYARDLEDPRGNQLRQIEQHYWKQRGVGTCIYTEEELTKKAKNNLILVQGFNKKTLPKIDGTILREIAALNEQYPIDQVLLRVEDRSGCPYPLLVEMLKYAVATGRVMLDLSERHLSWKVRWPTMTVNAESVADAEVLALAYEE